MIEWVVERMVGLIPALDKAASTNRELKDNALRSISHALNETYLYFRDMEKGKKRDLEIEAQLSKYWAAAAIPLRHIDKELAMACEYKSEYWINPETWGSEKIEKLGIGLDHVRKQYRSLLSPIKFNKM
jgi:hypothetical protein